MNRTVTLMYGSPQSVQIYTMGILIRKNVPLCFRYFYVYLSDWLSSTDVGANHKRLSLLRQFDLGFVVMASEECVAVKVSITKCRYLCLYFN